MTKYKISLQELTPTQIIGWIIFVAPVMPFLTITPDFRIMYWIIGSITILRGIISSATIEEVE